jgi:hypothetical protein
MDIVAESTRYYGDSYLDAQEEVDENRHWGTGVYTSNYTIHCEADTT